MHVALVIFDGWRGPGRYAVAVDGICGFGAGDVEEEKDKGALGAICRGGVGVVEIWMQDLLGVERCGRGESGSIGAWGDFAVGGGVREC